jgi:2-methylcitrate dehydratase PrpD
LEKGGKHMTELMTEPMAKSSRKALDGPAAIDGLTRRYAQNMAGLRYENLPPEVIQKAKLIVRDGVGNQIAASAVSEPAARVIEIVKEWGGTPQVTVTGYGLKLPAPFAVLCNGMLGHGVELDDAHGTGLIKCGSVMVSLAFAAAELKGCSGRDLLAAVVGGYEIAIRVAKAINPGHRQRGYHTTGTVALLGAAAAAARLLGCDEEQIACAIGLAAMQSAGIQAFLDDPCMAKPLSPGKGAMNGMIAAILASRGFTGPKKALESREGFLNAFTSSIRYADLVEDLGTHFAIMEVGFKPHAACRYAHGPLDLAQSMYHQDGVRLDQIEEVTVHMSDMAIRQASKFPCTNLNVAMGSTQFGAALAFSLGGNGLRDYWQGFKSKEVHEGAARVRLVAEPEFAPGGRQAIMEVKLKDGRTLRRRQEEPRGEPGSPLSAEEMERKFFGMAGMTLDEDRTRALNNRLMALDAEPNAGVIPPMTVVANGKPTLRAI